ncbi:MAG: hypothetical protein ACE5II_04410, partial [Anaerolineae bacterium]
MLWRAGCILVGVVCAPFYSRLPRYVVELQDVLLFFLSGWMGFSLGTYLELRVIRRIRYDTLGLAFFQAGASLVMVALASWAVLRWMERIGGEGSHPFVLY